MAEKILITGGAGFIGSNLTDELIKSHQVIIVDNLSTGQRKNLNSQAKFYQIDIRDPKISKIFEKEKPKIVFHLAAQINVRKSVENPIRDAEINILGSLNLLENCKKFGIKKIIFTSTGGAIYGESNIIPTPETYSAWPLSPYGIAKFAIEKYLNYYYKSFGLSYIALRLANVYGPRQNAEGEAGVVAIFCNRILKEQRPTIFGDGKQTRDFIFVEDVVEAAILALNKDKIGIFNVGMGRETSINEIFQKLRQLTGKEIEAVYAPAKKGDVRRSCLNYFEIKNEFGWEPKHTLEQGLTKTLESIIKKSLRKH